MSGIEVIGIIAAVLQLTQQAIAISTALGDLFGAVQAAPAKLRNGVNQLERLVEIAKLIRQNPLMQTESVEAHIKAIVDHTEALRRLITGIKSSSKGVVKRYWTVVTGNLKEKEMVEHFHQLEKDKTALMLSIMEIHTSLSSHTSSKVDGMRKDVQQLNQLIQRMCLERSESNPQGSLETPDGQSDDGTDMYPFSASEEIRTPCSTKRSHSNRVPISTSSISSSATPWHEQIEATSRGTLETPDGQREEDMDDDATTSSSVGNIRMPCSSSEKLWAESESYDYFYKNMEARDHAVQFNGNLGNPETLSVHHYDGLVATMRSIQVNGDVSNPAFVEAIMTR